MSARDAIFAQHPPLARRSTATAPIRRGGRSSSPGSRRHAAGVIPARGQLPPAERIALFTKMAEKVSATVVRVKSSDDFPGSRGGVSAGQ